MILYFDVKSCASQPPQPPENWDNVLDTIEDTAVCVQTPDASGSEDCLYLNVYVPLVRILCGFAVHSRLKIKNF